MQQVLLTRDNIEEKNYLFYNFKAEIVALYNRDKIVIKKWL